MIGMAIRKDEAYERLDYTEPTEDDEIIEVPQPEPMPGMEEEQDEQFGETPEEQAEIQQMMGGI